MTLAIGASSVACGNARLTLCTNHTWQHSSEPMPELGRDRSRRDHERSYGRSASVMSARSVNVAVRQLFFRCGTD